MGAFDDIWGTSTPEPGAFDDIWNAAPEKGLGQTLSERARTGVERLGAGLSAARGASPETIASDLQDTRQFKKSASEISYEQGMAEKAKAFNDNKSIGTLWDIGAHLLSSPKQLAGTVAESGASMFPGIIGAVGGAAAGSVVPGVGTVVGGIIGYLGGNLAANTQIEIAQEVEQKLADRGIDIDNVDAVSGAIKANPDILENSRAVKRALATTGVESAVDLFTVGIGSKVLKPATSTVSRALRVGGAAAGQGVAEGAGSVAADVAVGEEPNYGQALTEGFIGTLADAPVGVAGLAAGARLRPPAPPNEVFPDLPPAAPTAPATPTAGEVFAEIGKAQTVDEAIATAGRIVDQSLDSTDRITDDIERATAEPTAMELAFQDAREKDGSRVRPAVDPAVGEPVVELPAGVGPQTRVDAGPAGAIERAVSNDALTAPVEVPPAASASADLPVFTSKPTLGNGGYGASVGSVADGNRRQLMVDPAGGYYWGDYFTSSKRDVGAVTEGKHKDDQPAEFATSKEAREAAASVPLDKQEPYPAEVAGGVSSAPPVLDPASQSPAIPGQNEDVSAPPGMVSSATPILPSADYYRDEGIRDLAHRVKAGDDVSIEQAAQRMSANVPTGAVLVPMPSRTGRATVTKRLADRIAEITGAPVADVLRGVPRESLYDRKKRGESMSAEEFGFRVDGTMPANAVVVDNVIDTGATFEAVRMAMPGVRMLALARTTARESPTTTTEVANARQEEALPTGQAVDGGWTSIGKVATTAKAKEAAEALVPGTRVRTAFNGQTVGEGTVVESTTQMPGSVKIQWDKDRAKRITSTQSVWGLDYQAAPVQAVEPAGTVAAPLVAAPVQSLGALPVQQPKKVKKEHQWASNLGILDGAQIRFADGSVDPYVTPGQVYTVGLGKNSLRVTGPSGAGTILNRPQILRGIRTGKIEVVTKADPAFSRQTPASEPAPKSSERSSAIDQRVKRVQSHVTSIAAKWKNSPEVEVLATFADAPEDVRNYDAGSEAQGSPEGFIFGGKVYVVADQMRSSADVRRVMLHESLGHLGLRGTLGTRLDNVLDQVVLMRGADVQAKAKSYGLDWSNLNDRRTAAEEVLASIAQDRPEAGIVKRAVATIRSFLRDIGYDLDLSDNDIIANYILPARGFIERGEKGAGADSGGTGFSRKANPDIRFSRRQERVGDFDAVPQKDGSLLVKGDPAEIRALLPEGVVGRVSGDGLAFSSSDGPRVRSALEGNKLTYGRAGRVVEKMPMLNGKYRGAPPKFDTPGKIPTLRKILRNLADEGAPGRYWYENSSKAVLKFVGGDVAEAKKFVALLAIYSPQAKVDTNSTFALRAWAQYKAGQPISVKTGVMDSKAQAALDNADAFWSGEKTGNFVSNLMREIDQSTPQGATIDMWMMRAGQYDNDAPTKTQYEFMENETNRLAAELGWEPQQVQASIWVAMKARMENRGVKNRTEASSEKKGWIRFDYPIKKGKPTKTRVILDEQNHRDNWLREAFKLDVSAKDTAAAKFDFEDGVRRHIGQVSWEARPGRSTGVLPGVNDAPYDQQVEFQQAVHKSLAGPNGEDLLAQQLGLLATDDDILAPGVWQGEVAAGMQKRFAMAPDAGDTGKTSVDPAQQKALDIYASVLGWLLRQEGVGWHRPFYKAAKRDSNGLDIDVGRPLTPEEMRAVHGAIDEAIQKLGVEDWETRDDSVGIISSPKGVRVVTFGAVDNPTLQSTIMPAVAKILPDHRVDWFASSGKLVTNNWKENPDGQDYLGRASAEGRSDVFRWAADILAPRVQAVFDDFSKRYDWGDPGKIPALDAGREAAQEVRFSRQTDTAQTVDKRLDTVLADARAGPLKVTVKAIVAETGRSVTYQESATSAITDVKQRLTFARQLLQCLNS